MRGRIVARVVCGVVLLALVVAAGVYAYDLGVAHGLAQGGALAGASPGAPPSVAWHPWGFGFGFFPFFPLLFILFWVVMLRGLFWRGAWHHGGCAGRSGVPPAFEEWHRRAHDPARPPEPGSRS